MAHASCRPHPFDHVAGLRQRRNEPGSVAIDRVEIAGQSDSDRATSVHQGQSFRRGDDGSPNQLVAGHVRNNDVVDEQRAIAVQIVANLEAEQAEDVAGGVLDRHQAARPFWRTRCEMGLGEFAPPFKRDARQDVPDQWIGTIDQAVIEKARRQIVVHSSDLRVRRILHDCMAAAAAL